MYEVQAVDGDGNASQKIAAREVTGSPVIYTASGGFLAGKDYSYQGAHGWSYEEWAGATHKPVAWNGALGQRGLYEGALGSGPLKPMIGASWVLPGDSADAVRVFTLPYSGKVTISGTIHKDVYHPYGDGVRVKILKNNDQVWPASGWQTVAAGDVTGTPMEVKLAVRQGEKLDFVVNQNEDPRDDETVWDPHVTYEQIADPLRKEDLQATDDDSTRLHYTGTGWQRLGRNPCSSDIDQGYLSGWFQGTLTASETPGDKLQVRFHGTGIDVLGQTGSNQGMANIMLDGKNVGAIDTFAPQQIIKLTPEQAQVRHAEQWQTDPPTVLWGIRDLADADHVLELEVTGQKNEKGTGTAIGIDAVVIQHGATVMSDNSK